MKYVVIRFEQLPHANVQKYVCVPEPWIKWRDESKETIIVAYPEEDPAPTGFVEKGVKYSRDWKCYKAEEVAEFHKYTAAVAYIKGLNDGGSDESDDSNRQPIRNNASTDKSEIREDHTRQMHGEPQKSKIVLPPEYNPNFPRWSLKYPELNYFGSEDLIELESGTIEKPVKASVFANRRGYEKCFEESSNASSLTRKLLSEIFNLSALQVCNLAGQGFQDRKDAESGKRPALYVHAVTALQDTVLRKYGASGTKPSDIRSYIQSALSGFRKKKLNDK